MSVSPAPPEGDSGLGGSIPYAPFAEDVAELVIPGDTPELTLRKFSELNSKYRLMEQNMSERRERAEAKRADLLKGLEAVRMISTHPAAEFELADTLFARATVTDKERVGIWLGANVMAEYSPAEAVGLLEKRVQDAERIIREAEQVAFFLREQITTMEVSMARMYNLVQARSKTASQE